MDGNVSSWDFLIPDEISKEGSVEVFKEKDDLPVGLCYTERFDANFLNPGVSIRVGRKDGYTKAYNAIVTDNNITKITIQKYDSRQAYKMIREVIDIEDVLEGTVTIKIFANSEGE